MAEPTAAGPAPSRRQPPEVRREQILDAAERLFVERGLATSMAELAAAAGVAKGTVYLYFESKDELLAALRARYVARFVDRLVDGRADGPRSHLAAVQRFAIELYDWSVTSAALHHVLFHEAGVSEEDAFAHGRGVLGDEVRAGVESGEFSVDDPELTSHFLLHGIHAMLVTTMRHGHADRERFVRGVEELIPRVLTRPAGAS